MNLMLHIWIQYPVLSSPLKAEKHLVYTDYVQYFILLYAYGAMETPQHGIGPKSEFGSVSFFFQELSEIPLKLESVEEFPNILGRFPLYLHLIRFPFFLVRFLFFLGQFPVFRKSFKLSVC